MPPYAYLQMQESLAVLYRLEPDPGLKDDLKTTMKFLSDRAKSKLPGALSQLKTRDLTAVAPDWREVGGLNGDYRVTWYAPRQCGELALVILLDEPNGSFDQKSAEILTEALSIPDYAKLTSCGIFHLIGAGEKAMRLGKL